MSLAGPYTGRQRLEATAKTLEVIRHLARAGSGGRTVDELSCDLRINRRTVFRILEALRRLDCPVKRRRASPHVVYMLARREATRWLFGQREKARET